MLDRVLQELQEVMRWSRSTAGLAVAIDRLMDIEYSLSDPSHVKLFEPERTKAMTLLLGQLAIESNPRDYW
jgi:hypothetical protein